MNNKIINKINQCTFCVQDNDTVLRGPGYTRPAEPDGAAQRLHNSQVGHPPHWLFLCNTRRLGQDTREKWIQVQRNF